MKVLSLTQPWATLMAIDAKRYETRSWSTAHRGPLAIAASKGFPRECRELCSAWPFAHALDAAGIGMAELDSARGHVLSVVDLAAVVPTRGNLPWHAAEPSIAPAARYESEFGNYTDGRFAWLTRNVRRLGTPIAAKGRLGLWDIDDAMIEAALAAGRTP